MSADTVVIRGTKFHYRQGTHDLSILDHVYDRNGYHLPEDMSGMWMVDVGAHIGAATILAAQRGAEVLAIEPCEANNERLAANVVANGLRELVTVAREGAGVGQRSKVLLMHHPTNTGGHSTSRVVGEAGEWVYLQSLADWLDLVPRCDILKLDCQGCETGVVDEIMGGLHERLPLIVAELDGEDRDVLRKRLEEHYVAEHLGWSEWRFTHR